MRHLKESILIGKPNQRQYAYFERDSGQFHRISRDHNSEIVENLPDQLKNAVKCLLRHSQDVQDGWVHKELIYREVFQEEPPEDSNYPSKFNKMISQLGSKIRGFDNKTDYIVKNSEDKNYYKICLLDFPFDDYKEGFEFLQDYIDIDNCEDIEGIDICSHTGNYLYKSFYVHRLFKKIPFRIIINHPDIAKNIINHFGNRSHFDDVDDQLNKWKKLQSEIRNDNTKFEIKVSQIPILHHYICIRKKKENESIALLTFYTYGVELHEHYRETCMEGSTKYALFYREFDHLWTNDKETFPLNKYCQSKKMSGQRNEQI